VVCSCFGVNVGRSHNFLNNATHCFRGVSSDKLGDVLALAGDSSDNIPGVRMILLDAVSSWSFYSNVLSSQAPGIGPKIAAALINEFGSLDNLINGADTIKQKKRRESLMDNAEKVVIYPVIIDIALQCLLVAQRIVGIFFFLSIKVLLFRKLVSLDDSIPIDNMTLPSSFHNVSDFRMSPFDPNR
jgi:5'-3' exonuclease